MYNGTSTYLTGFINPGAHLHSKPVSVLMTYIFCEVSADRCAWSNNHLSAYTIKHDIDDYTGTQWLFIYTRWSKK